LFYIDITSYLTETGMKCFLESIAFGKQMIIIK
jgi:hypothetical protein